MPGAPDVVVIGGGVAGSAAAAFLARRGVGVLQVDPRPRTGNVFKAEKVEPDQAELLRQLGLFDVAAQALTRIEAVDEGCFGRVVRRVPIEQYGMRYHELADALRGAVPAGCRLQDRVVAIRPHAESPTVELAGGGTLNTRLVIVAAGTDHRLREGLSQRLTCYGSEFSFSLGFDVARCDGRPFPFPSLTYFPDSIGSRLAYVTLFRVGAAMRVNLFTYQQAGGAFSAAFRADPARQLHRVLPRLRSVTGDLRVTSKVQGGVIDLYRVEDPARPGVVLIADAFQSACPATGTGLSKALNDALVLCRDFVPAWLGSRGRPIAIEDFYRHPGKREIDGGSLEGALYRRQVSLEASPRWRLHRARVLARLLLSGCAQAAQKRLSSARAHHA